MNREELKRAAERVGQPPCGGCQHYHYCARNQTACEQFRGWVDASVRNGEAKKNDWRAKYGLTAPSTQEYKRIFVSEQP